MNKEFCTCKQSLALKDLGFDEPCFSYYVDCELRGVNLGMEELGGVKPYYERFGYHTINNHHIDNKNKIITSAPLKQQAFRWFREKHNLCGEIYTVNMGAIDYTFQIRDLYSEDVKHDNFEAYTGGYIGTFSTYEEAEDACLDKLIEIVKTK